MIETVDTSVIPSNEEQMNEFETTDNSEIECSICLDTIQFSEQCTNNCGHTFCKSCLDSWLDDGKTTCPMCRQTIQYLTYQGETRRLIIQTITPEQTVQTNRRRTNQNPDTITLNRGLYCSFKFVFMVMALCSGIQIAFIHRLQYQNDNTDYLYEQCMNNNSQLHKIIENSGYVTLGDYEKYLIMDRDTSDFYVCNIPRYFVDHCFT